MHHNSKLLFMKYAADLFKDNMRVLEIGPAEMPSAYEKAVNNKAITWKTLDLSPLKKTDYIADAEYSFSISDDEFDIVLSCQVVEHVRKIWIWTKELTRVCKPGGFVILISPVNWPYHEAPYDCWRIYPEGMKALYEECGLEVILTKREALDRCAGLRCYLSCGKRILTSPVYSVKRLICGLQDWHDWMAEDVIAVGKKRFNNA